MEYRLINEVQLLRFMKDAPDYVLLPSWQSLTAIDIEAIKECVNECREYAYEKKLELENICDDGFILTKKEERLLKHHNYCYESAKALLASLEGVGK
jgi:hypothetical protein